MKLPTLPKVVNLGLGIRVPVTGRANIPTKDGEYTLIEAGGPRIDINMGSPLWEQYEAYAHELVHAAIDANRHILQTIVRPLREEAERTAREIKEERGDF